MIRIDEEARLLRVVFHKHNLDSYHQSDWYAQNDLDRYPQARRRRAPSHQI